MVKKKLKLVFLFSGLKLQMVSVRSGWRTTCSQPWIYKRPKKSNGKSIKHMITLACITFWGVEWKNRNISSCFL